MLPLKVAILWHYHQPYYEKDGEFILPWVRLHGVKDYWDLPELFHEFPNIKQTINLVPSLNIQIDGYVSHRMIDKIQRLTLLKPDELKPADKREILRLFFLCNEENMIKPYPRYKELFDISQDKDRALKNFTEQDWLDLQVWYNLTWFGYFSRERKYIKRLFRKGRDFTEEEKKLVLEVQLDVLSGISPQLKMLQSLKQVEISCTPMYHPILPLVCDTDSAREAMPDVILPDLGFKYPQDAKGQINDSLNYYEKTIGFKPRGMWPSEGSISNEVLDIMIESGISWAATDESVIAATMNDKYEDTQKYFLGRYHSDKGDISLLFRDHTLSDAIGFVYSRWNPHDAARDFCSRLTGIRNALVNKYGEDCLKYTVVPVILDGENCWEFYQYNGLPFMRAFFEQLTNSGELKTVTCLEAVSSKEPDFLTPITNIRAGSWINSDFKIWFGHEEHRKAWTMLAKARQAVENNKDKISSEFLKEAMEQVYIAEGSDWFWWYGDTHIAENKGDFDVLFRWHIGNIYKLLGLEIPKEVNVPIGKAYQAGKVVKQEGEVKPSIDGKVSTDEEWKKAGYYDASGSMSTMHQVGEILDRFWYGSDQDNVYFRCDLLRKIENEVQIEIKFQSPKEFVITISENSFEVSSENDLSINKFSYSQKDIVEFAISKKTFADESSAEFKNLAIELTICTKFQDSELYYPRQGCIELLV